MKHKTVYFDLTKKTLVTCITVLTLPGLSKMFCIKFKVQELENAQLLLRDYIQALRLFLKIFTYEYSLHNSSLTALQAEKGSANYASYASFIRERVQAASIFSFRQQHSEAEIRSGPTQERAQSLNG